MFRQFYAFLVAHDLLTLDPTRTVLYVKPEKRRQILVSASDFARVIRAVRHRRTFFAVRNECMLLVAFDTMVRLRELTSLKVTAVKLYPDRLIHVIGKGRKERIVSFSEETAQRLLIYLSRRSREKILGELLFSTRDGSEITKRNTEHIFERCGNLANPPVKLTPHLMRRSAATLYRQLTGDIQLVGDILGHESLATTELYTRSSQLGILAAYQRISPVSYASGQKL
jgi:integrase/recombinase XerC